MSAGAAAAALDGAATRSPPTTSMEADAGLPETMDASAVATGFLPVRTAGAPADGCTAGPSGRS